ncbi:MAG: hypothetical protein SVY53_05290 [Chloroflexota bacterium]|nr:hypothetical protein [Chloroflexota bacterium]
MAEGTDNPESTGGQEQSVPQSKYIGVKEMLRKEEEGHKATKTSLESTLKDLDAKSGEVNKLAVEVERLSEQIKTAPQTPTDELAKLQEKVGLLETQLQEKTSALESVSRESIVKEYGLEEDVVKDIPIDQLPAMKKVLAAQKAKLSPNPDVTGGGQTMRPASSLELFKQGLAERK